MVRSLACLALATLLLALTAAPARAANPDGLLNRIARSLGLGWSDGYHSAPAQPGWGDSGWQVVEGEGRVYYEALPPGEPIAPAPAPTSHRRVPQP